MAYQAPLGPRGLPIAYQVRELRIEPAVVLAPMEGVTDLPFRRLVRRLGGPGLTCTEFVASTSLKHGKGQMWETAQVDPDEHPVSVQLYGKDPARMGEAARVVEALGADICDINMGCPSKKVCRKSGGSALMREPELAARVVRSVRAATTLPVTVKMRSGFDAGLRNAPELARICEAEGANALTIHWRTREDRYGGERQVDKIAEAVQAVDIPVLGNGDVVDVASAVAMLRDTGCAGGMVGRGAMRDPWVCGRIAAWLRGEEPRDPSPEERLGALLSYFDAMEAHFGRPKAALGRMKMVSKQVLGGLPLPVDTVKTVLRSGSRAEAEGHLRAAFSTL